MSVFPETPCTLLVKLAAQMTGRSDEFAWQRFFELYQPAIVKFAEKPGAVSDEEVRDNAEFWDWMTKRLLSDPQFAKRRAERWRRTADEEWDPDHRMGVRAFARLRLTHAKLYARQAKNPIAFARAIRQAIAIDPQDKETCINYAAFLKVNKLDAVREDFLGCLEKLGVDTDGWR